MRQLTIWFWGLALYLLCVQQPGIGTAQDMRELSLQQQKMQIELQDKAAIEKKEAEKQAAASRSLIKQDRLQLERAISDLEKRKADLKQDIERLQKEGERLIEEEQQISHELAQTDQIIKELVGVIRINAKDITTLFVENQQSVLVEEPPEVLDRLVDESSFPGMEGISELSGLLFHQIKMTGEVSRSASSIINRDGRSVSAEILLLGPFTAAYRLDKEVGFLRYSSAGQKLYALSKLPSGRMQKQLGKYMDGESETVPMDIGRGAALQQLSHKLSLWEQVEKGGPIVWPILLIFIVGLLIIIERIFFLLRKKFNNDSFMQTLNEKLGRKDWSQAETYCDTYLKKPVPRIIRAGLGSRNQQREDMENVLQEAILREIPPLERFLSTLGMLAAIAPLLGLLGTVTGMIDTFHIITLHGTGDPRLMSGGISEALVTTMLGLGVAIPLMLAQTLLNRSVEKEIGTMEEKAVVLVNVIHKSRLG